MKHCTDHNPVQIISGEGSRTTLSCVLPKNKTASYLLVTTEGMLRRGTAQELMDTITGDTSAIHIAQPNPDLDTLDAAIATFGAQNKAAITAVIALGGGSVMDSAKALACGVAENAPPKALEQWLRNGVPVNVQPLPLYCLPTTAGTGSEVTPFATIWDNAYQKKRSLAGTYSFARAAILDPALTLSLPWNETLYGALDALSHALETLWNKNATLSSAKYAVQAINLIIQNLHKVEQNPQDCAARSALQEGACFAGLAITQSKTSIAHAISYPLTLHFGVPHGLACSAYLDSIMNFVTINSGWNPLLSTQKKEEITCFLSKYTPRTLLETYAKPNGIAQYLDEMFSPERANTFSIPITQEDVRSFIFA